MDFKKRSDLHWERKCWHMCGVTFLAVLFAKLPLIWFSLFLVLLWLVAVPLDVLRQSRPQLNTQLLRWFRPIMRDHEKSRLAGTTFLLSGVGIVSLVFPKDIVLLTLLYLAFADPLASLIGIKFGKDKIFGHKSVQGSVAAFVVCAVATYLYLYFNGILLDRIWIVALLGGVIGCFSELVPIGNIDDNLTLPLVSAIFLWVMFYFMGVYSQFGSAGSL